MLDERNPDKNVMVGHRWHTIECHRLPVVAHHTDVQLIAGGPLATLFAGGEPPLVYQWQIPPSDCRLRASFAAHSHWWTTGVMLSGKGG